MKIEKFSISNFRCFGEDAVDFSLQAEVTALIGNNGSGKTAIFAALGRMFGTSSIQRAFKRSDFHIPFDQENLISGTKIVLDCILGFPELDADEADDEAVPEVFHHMAATGEDAPLKVRMRLEATWTDDGTPDGTIEEEFRWVAALDEEFEWEDCRPVQAVERNFVQLVYVPASRNASDQVTNLLKGRLWRAAKWSNELRATAREGSNEIQEEFDSEEPASFISERLEKRWSQVHQGDTDKKPTLRLIESSFDELVRRAEFVFVPDEQGHSRHLDELSDGQRSLFHIALTAATLEIERDAIRQNPEDSAFDQEKLRRTLLTILAIEEPENSLSPFFLSRIILQAREIGGMDSAQVVISSHSPSILSRIEPEEVRYSRLDASLRRSSIKGLTLPDEDEEARKYVRLAVKAYPELYFARFVVLAEGDSESIVLPSIAAARGLALDRSFVPIVPLAGRFVRHFWRLLADIEIPYATLLDLDLGRRHGGAALIRKTVEELAAIGKNMVDNPLVIDGTVDLDTVDQIDDAALLAQDQEHPWIKALRREDVYFSSPIDVDFSMLTEFPDAYRHAKENGLGPRTDNASIAQKKATTLKTGGNPNLFPNTWNDEFTWYPYLFLSESKPEAHLNALARLDDAALRANSPVELRFLLAKIKKRVLG